MRNSECGIAVEKIDHFEKTSFARPYLYFIRVTINRSEATIN